MKVFIPVLEDNLLNKCISRGGDNPGMGGTTFTSIQMGILLAESEPELTVCLVTRQTIYVIDPPANLCLLIANSLEHMLTEYISSSDRPVVISPAVYIQELSSKHLVQYAEFIIPWIRHPFFFRLTLVRHRFRAYVCVGSYQYESNRHYYKPILHIQNIFRTPQTEPVYPKLDCNDSKANLNLVYLGSLIPAKGFHIISRHWSQIKSRFPGVVLHVIGSASGRKRGIPDHQVLPTSETYAKAILKNIPFDDITSNKVIFHGNLGIEKSDIIKNCHAALLNPTGCSEAFPASPLQCMALGVPVIASKGFGMSDCMRYFPELTIHRPAQIVSKLEMLIQNPLQYQEYQVRSRNTALWFQSQTESILLRWRLLIKAFTENASKPIEPFSPVLPFYESRFNLLVKAGLRVAHGTLTSFKH
jgi:glycosyltransferase involved in cell wall biosynthesis